MALIMMTDAFLKKWSLKNSKSQCKKIDDMNELYTNNTDDDGMSEWRRLATQHKVACCVWSHP